MTILLDVNNRYQSTGVNGYYFLNIIYIIDKII